MSPTTLTPRSLFEPRTALLGIAMTVAFTVTFTVLASPDATSEPRTDPIVATWHGGELGVAELESWFAYRGQADPAADREDAIRQVAFLKSFAANAQRDGLGDDARTRLYLESARRSLLLDRLKEHVTSGVSVSSQEVEALRLDNPQAFHRPRKLKLRNLYLPFGSDPEAARRTMQDAHRRLAEGADFPELARSLSQSQTAQRGGAMGWLDPLQLPPSLAGAVRELAPGELTGPLEHGSGLTIFLCEDERDAVRPDAEEQRRKIEGQLLRHSRREAWSRAQEDLLRAADPKIDVASADVVVELSEDRLTAAELRELAAARAPRMEFESRPEALRSLARQWALEVVAAKRAVELGLHDDASLLRTLHWQRVEFLARRAIAKVLEGRMPAPNESDLQRFFAENRQRYRLAAAYDLSLLHFGPAEDEPARLAGARDVAERLRTGEIDFADAARRHSIHPSAAGGGHVGWTSHRQVAGWGPTVSRTLRVLGPGEISPLFHLESGLWLFRVEGDRGQRAMSFEEVEDQVRNDWSRTRFDRLRDELADRHLGDIGFELRSTETEDSPQPRSIRWSTASEFENLGYHVYRGDQADGPFERLTAEPIPGAGTSDVPHSYRFEDATAVPGRLYYYYVESISTSGQRKQLTPVRATPASGTGEAESDGPT